MALTQLDDVLPDGKREEIAASTGGADTAVPADTGDPTLSGLFAAHNGAFYLTPGDLRVSGETMRRGAMIGSCFLEGFVFHAHNPSGCPVDLITVNNAGTLPDPPSPNGAVADYDFQVIQIPLRALLPDAMLWRLSYNSVEAHERAFQEVCAMLAFQLKCCMEWNVQHGLLSFVMNFLVPQRNTMGSLLPRFDLRNPEHFVHKLNEHLEGLVMQYRNAYILDVDRISASLGRRYVQDDIFHVTSHNGLIWDTKVDADRMEPLLPMSKHYELLSHATIREAIWSEIVAMYRAVHQIDSIKLVVVDADDTLWRGVSGDMAEVGTFMLEGWPLGMAEALGFLKKRGILLGLISKNDEGRLRSIWPKILGWRLDLENFAAVRINWRPKAENMREILTDANLLPRSVLFIDDNPVERAAMKQAFPDMRVLGRHPYYLKRILLWSPETQVAAVTEESNRRTEMIQAQFARESQRREMSREEFLRSAAPKVTVTTIDNPEHKRFRRVFELINKTNQFNTVGRRWKWEECLEFFATGGLVYAFEVTDSFTDYGLVGVVLLRSDAIEQWVMSCRVLGYQIEEAVMAVLVRAMRGRGAGDITGQLVETDVNFPCRDLFAKCGFVKQEHGWVLGRGTEIVPPGHVAVLSSEQVG